MTDSWTITIGDTSMTPAQWLGLMGVWRHCPSRRPDVPGALTASMAFDALVQKASKRGFTERRLLKAAMRTGLVGPTALKRCEAVVAHLPPAELLREVGAANRSMELLASHQPTAWGCAA